VAECHVVPEVMLEKHLGKTHSYIFILRDGDDSILLSSLNYGNMEDSDISVSFSNPVLFTSWSTNSLFF
jgi:hypothetical protein